MYPISFEEFEKYYQGSSDFNYVVVPECGVVLYYRDDNNELVAIDDGDKYCAKYLYWKVEI